MVGSFEDGTVIIDCFADTTNARTRLECHVEPQCHAILTPVHSDPGYRSDFPTKNDKLFGKYEDN